MSRFHLIVFRLHLFPLTLQRIEFFLFELRNRLEDEKRGDRNRPNRLRSIFSRMISPTRFLSILPTIVHYQFGTVEPYRKIETWERKIDEQRFTSFPHCEISHSILPQVDSIEEFLASTKILEKGSCFDRSSDLLTWPLVRNCWNKSSLASFSLAFTRFNSSLKWRRKSKSSINFRK